MQTRTRIAPSPTGIAHLGTMYTALINYAFAKKNKGKFILRIEDTDRERYVPGSEKVIYDSLYWLGIAYTEGPDIGGPYAPYTQSERLHLYQRYVRELVSKKLAYYCFCTPERLTAMRQEQQKSGKLPMYDGLCRKIKPFTAASRAEKEKHTIRLAVPKTGNTAWNDLIRGRISFANRAMDHQVLLKSDGFPTYHLAVVVDDHLMKISHVIRAEEWISSTPKHILLYQAFSWKMPQFAHTPLLRNPDHSKLSKRKNPVSVVWFKEEGFLPEALVNFLCLMGWSHPQGKEKFSFAEFLKHFNLQDMQTTQPIFDLEKLRWLNGSYLREKTDTQLFDLLLPLLPETADPEKVRQIIPIVKERLHTLKEFSSYTGFLFTDPSIGPDLIVKQSHLPRQAIKQKLLAYIKILEPISAADFQVQILDKKSRELLDDVWNVKKFFMTIRVAVTGTEISPPLFESLAILGKQKTLERLYAASEKL